MNSPKFSVIIPTYNRECFIENCVESVLDQSFNNFEVIVINDGSTDRTEKLLRPYNDEIEYIYQENKGVSTARNRGLQEARGKYIAFLDSDDKWTSEKLEVVDENIKQNPEFKIFHTQERWYKDGKIHNPKDKHRKPHGKVFFKCLRLCAVSISTAVVKREVFHKIGEFDESLPVCEDYDFWIRASLNFPIYLVDEVLTVKDGGRGDQLSMIYWGKDKFRAGSIAKLMRNNKLSGKEYQMALKELRKKCRIYGKGCVKRGRKDEGEYYLNLPERIEEEYSEIKNR